jgi:hypothetical protein
MLIKLKMTLTMGKRGEGLLIYERRRDCENLGPHASLACEDAFFLGSSLHEAESLACMHGRRSLQPVEKKYGEINVR